MGLDLTVSESECHTEIPHDILSVNRSLKYYG